jgi:hypothetical protein
MKMIRNIYKAAVCILLIAIPPVWASDQPTDVQGDQAAPVVEKQDEGPWQAVGQEVKEATGAVVEATRESAGTAWEALKSGSTEVWERSKGAWHATREETQELWEKGRAKIHEATAPEEPAAAASPVTPPSSGPPNPHPPEGTSDRP